MTKTAFLFPGQGSQSVGMGQWLAEGASKDLFARVDEVLDFPMRKLMAEGPAETLKETTNAQPAILAVSVAVGRILLEKGITPTVMAGHSLGEYSALVIAESLKFEDALRLVRLRGKYMQEAVPLGEGTMSAILGLSDDLVEIICREVTEAGDLVEPANYNCPGQLVISGTVQGVEKAVTKLKEQGAKRCIPLEVSAPFHSSLLKPAADKLAVELKKTEFKKPETPYIANVDCALIESENDICQRLIDQIWKPVRWTQTLQRIVAETKPDRVIEVGPGKVLSGHLKKVDKTIPTFTTDTEENLKKLK